MAFNSQYRPIQYLFAVSEREFSFPCFDGFSRAYMNDTILALLTRILVDDLYAHESASSFPENAGRLQGTFLLTLLCISLFPKITILYLA